MSALYILLSLQNDFGQITLLLRDITILGNHYLHYIEIVIWSISIFSSYRIFQKILLTSIVFYYYYSQQWTRKLGGLAIQTCNRDIQQQYRLVINISKQKMLEPLPTVYKESNSPLQLCVQPNNTTTSTLLYKYLYLPITATPLRTIIASQGY